MLAALLLVTAAHAAECSQTSFVFVGQPDCVELDYTDGRTRVTNTCDQALLIDQSVLLPARGSASSPFIPPQSSVDVRDLSAFTVGLSGELFRVVAMIETPAGCEQPKLMVSAAPPSDADTAGPQEL